MSQLKRGEGLNGGEVVWSEVADGKVKETTVLQESRNCSK